MGVVADPRCVLPYNDRDFLRMLPQLMKLCTITGRSLEFYQAYSDFEELVQMSEDLLRDVVTTVTGSPIAPPSIPGTHFLGAHYWNISCRIFIIERHYLPPGVLLNGMMAR